MYVCEQKSVCHICCPPPASLTIPSSVVDGHAACPVIDNVKRPCLVRVTETDELVAFHKAPGTFMGEQLGAEYVPIGNGTPGIEVYGAAPTRAAPC